MEDSNLLPPLHDLFFAIPAKESSSPSGSHNEDGELFGKLCETPSTYDNIPIGLSSDELEETPSSGNEDDNLSTYYTVTPSMCGEIPIVLSTNILSTDEGKEWKDCSPKYEESIPQIVVTTSPENETDRLGQKSNREKPSSSIIGNNKPGGGKTVAMNEPYLQNPIISHYQDSGHPQFWLRLSL
ncbi:hypothetical protein UA08_09470 [Talaromyces atroroseus]|uniref:Uncharacterized protein n=1 Tax=Talaromyces atroroseus TaxID=1441469 RepID=A0A1Q5Q5Z4_TALAT|nr:hypothetical protein UA08_09470 [Talaromyces atroroseus]OKL55248.1 hypothetical protein UA08_09470 [Talaromyces atroroseus]